MKKILPILFALAFGSVSAQAQLLLDFSGFFATPSGLQITLSDLTTDPPTEVTNPASPTNWDTGSLQQSGTLSLVSGSASFVFTVNGYNTSSLSGNDLALSGLADFTKNGADGWGVSGGSGNDISADDVLTFTFDLNSLGTNLALQVIDVQLSDTGGSFSGGADMIVDGISTTSLSSLSNDLTGSPVTVSNGDLLGFRLSDTSSSADFRLDSITLQVVAVPEPSSFALLGLGVGALALLRRRRI